MEVERNGIHLIAFKTYGYDGIIIQAVTDENDIAFVEVALECSDKLRVLARVVRDDQGPGEGECITLMERDLPESEAHV